MDNVTKDVTRMSHNSHTHFCVQIRLRLHKHFLGFPEIQWFILQLLYANALEFLHFWDYFYNDSKKVLTQIGTDSVTILFNKILLAISPIAWK